MRARAAAPSTGTPTDLAPTAFAGRELQRPRRRRRRVRRLPGSDDWANLRLNQIGTRRNVGGLYLVPGTSRFAVGPLSLSSRQRRPRQGRPGQRRPRQGRPRQGRPRQGRPRQGRPRQGRPRQGRPRQGRPRRRRPLRAATRTTRAASSTSRPPPTWRDAAEPVHRVCGRRGAARHRRRSSTTWSATWTTPTVGGVASFTLYRVVGAGAGARSDLDAGAHVPGSPASGLHRSTGASS